MTKEKLQNAYAIRPKINPWMRFGFSRAYLPYVERPDEWQGCIKTEIITVLDWRDWLRLLVSRKINVVVEIETEFKSGNVLSTRTDSRILPPNFSIEHLRK